MFFMSVAIQYVLFIDIELCVRVCVSVAFPCGGFVYYFSTEISSELNFTIRPNE